MDFEKLKQTQRYSHIGMHSDSNAVYAFQYKHAFDTLYESKDAVDTIALPMMYLMRHYLELILKYNIKYFSQFSESNFMINSIKNEHKLKPLAEGFKQHWRLVVKKYSIIIDDAKYISNFEDLIVLVDEIDQYSMSFRYPYDKNGNKHFEWDKTLDIYKIKKSLDKVIPLLNHSMDVFYDQAEQYLKIEEDILNEIEREMFSDIYSSNNYI